MITKSGEFTWMANSSITPQLLPQLVEEVALLSGEYLIYDNDGEVERVNIKAAIANKELADKYALNAKIYLDLLKSENITTTNVNYLMQQAAAEGGKHFFIYCSALRIFGPQKDYPALPKVIASCSELKEYWEEGFYAARRELYHFSS